MVLQGSAHSSYNYSEGSTNRIYSTAGDSIQRPGPGIQERAAGLLLRLGEGTLLAPALNLWTLLLLANLRLEHTSVR